MPKLTVSLFILSFLVLGFAFYLVPQWMHKGQKELFQLSLFILACFIDIVALRYQQKHSINR